MKKALYWLDANLENVISGISLLVIIAMMFTQVMIRFIWGSGLAAAEELSRFSFLILVYFGSSFAAARCAHIRVTAHLKYLPPWMMYTALLLGDILWLCFNGIVIYQGCSLIAGMAQRPMISGALLWDMRPIFAIVPVTFALQVIRVIQVWFKHFTHSKNDPMAEVLRNVA